MKTTFRQRAISAIALLTLTAGTVFACEYCWHGPLTVITGSGSNAGDLTCFSGSFTRKDYDDLPSCKPTDDTTRCYADGDIEVNVTTYTHYSLTCVPPDWVIDPEAPPSEIVPNCGTDDGCMG